MRILLPYCRGVPERTFYQDFHQGIADALRELGHEAVQFPFTAIGQPAQAEAEALFRQVERGNFSAVLDLACWGYGLSGITLVMQNGRKEPIFDAFSIPYAAMLLDQPHNQALNGIRALRLHVIHPDLGHPEQIRLAFPDLKPRSEIFAPPAIRPRNDRSAANSSSERDIDVLYVGNLVPEALERFWNDRGNPLWQSAYDPLFCDALADAALDQPERSLHLSVAAVLTKIGAQPPDFDFNSQLRAVECFLRFIFRRDAVAALAGSGVQMRVVGRGWESVDLPASVEFSPTTDYEEFFCLAGRAKICLDASTYLDGVNDRVFSYALNGAVCFTNAAGYLRRVFDEDDGVRFYSMRDPAELGDQVKSLLARPQALHDAGQRAREAVLASHTWRHRISDILGAMRLGTGSMGGILPPAPGR